jgi:hypothetical protein
MAYDQNESGGGAAQALGDESANEQETPQENSSEDSFFIPQDVLGGKTYKQGDKITLEVMGEDQDGDLEVCFPGSEGGDWRDELKTKLTDAGSPSGQGGMA